MSRTKSHLDLFLILSDTDAKENIVNAACYGAIGASVADIQMVKASVWVIVDGPWHRVTGVNQPVEFTASGNGGTPPYTFRWYTTFLDPTIPAEHWQRVMVPNSNSSTFTFVASVPGRYGISIGISDSKGEGEYQSFQPIGIVVTVQKSPVPQITPSPSPTPAPSPLNISLYNYENKTFSENSVQLNFSLSQPTQWIAYSLDGQTNVTIDGNTTLTGLRNGPHTVIIYANGTYGNAAAPQTIAFNVKVPDPFPIMEATLIIITVIVGTTLAISLIKKLRAVRVTDNFVG